MQNTKNKKRDKKLKKGTKKDTKILGYHASTISLFKSGKRKISWPLAAKLCELFPGKSLKEWKEAGTDDLCRVFDLIEKETNK